MGARRARSEVSVAEPRLLLSEVSQAGAAGPAGAGAGSVQGPAALEARQEISMARAIRRTAWRAASRPRTSRS